MARIPDDSNDATLQIDGLRFERNAVLGLNGQSPWFSHKVISSPGPLVSDFVTHGPEFEYSTYGIHIGQEDRLTFFGDDDRLIVGHFIDCRDDSPTKRMRVTNSFSASMYRRLVIPRGVAHTFDNLAGIVTRDEPIWYASEQNPHWNVNNDLISILRSDTSDLPEVAVCKYRFSDDLHNFMTRLSQAVLEKPKAYSTRFRLRVGGEDRYVMFQENTWDHEGRTLEPLIEAATGSPVMAVPSKYAITGKASWTLVPNTAAGVADILLLRSRRDAESTGLQVHRRTRRHYTFLTQEGSRVVIDTLDLRPSSPTFGERWSFATVCDPRISYVVSPGIAYSFNAERDMFIRAESEVFVSESEPRADLPMFGVDAEIIDPERFSRNQPEIPTLLCSERVVRRLAQHEGAACI